MARLLSRSGTKASNPVAAATYGLARVLSKRGLCSRSQAEQLIRDGRVRVRGRVCLDPERRTALDEADIRIDGQPAAATRFMYLMLNKPRGLVTTRSDERGRTTVYDCLDDPSLPWLAPVGRLDQASEGLLLFSNDSIWSAHIAAPQTHLPKTYHVQVDRQPGDDVLDALRCGIVDAGEHLVAIAVKVLRRGERTAWMEIVLDEGRNRQIRRMLAAMDIAVLRLVRIAVGKLMLGDLPKGRWRVLTAEEVNALVPSVRPNDRAFS